VLSLLRSFRGLARAVAAVWRDPETKALPLVAGGLVLTGTIFYWRFEDWTLILERLSERRHRDKTT
jgi:hypothetical protein